MQCLNQPKDGDKMIEMLRINGQKNDFFTINI